MRFGMIVLSVVGLFIHAHAAGTSCRCEKVKCGPCENDTGRVEFVKSSCGKHNEKTKSCMRPVCEPMQTAECKAKQNKDVSKEQKAASQEPIEKRVIRVPAFAQQKSVGMVIASYGSAYIHREDGQKLKSKVGRKVFQGDVLETTDTGRMKVVFHDQNRLIVSPNSRIEIKTQEYEKKQNIKRSLYRLLYGKVRSQVDQKYKKKSNYYKIKTPAAVAGVRGTDFVTSYDKLSAETRIATLEGHVELGGIGSNKTIMVSSGRYASYVVPEAQDPMFSEKDITEFVHRGKLTPVYKLSKSEIEMVEKESRDLNQREIASAHQPEDQLLCSDPPGDFNECSWVCVNNSSGAKTCEVEKEDVYCQRKRCNASGQWAEETRLPASATNRCDPVRTVIGPCDY
jgi:hypothetical protein